jgi:hypothetical protein
MMEQVEEDALKKYGMNKEDFNYWSNLRRPKLIRLRMLFN